MSDHYVTVQFMSRLFRIPVRTLRRWAAQDQWDRTSPRHYPVRYRFADASESVNQRRHAPTRAAS